MVGYRSGVTIEWGLYRLSCTAAINIINQQFIKFLFQVNDHLNITMLQNKCSFLCRKCPKTRLRASTTSKNFSTLANARHEGEEREGE